MCEGGIMSELQEKPNHFIHNIVEEHIATGRFEGRVHTRFPPEPNGFLHVGHAKAILISYSTAKRYSGKFNLRFDDTNPAKEDMKFVDAIKEDMAWLGTQWDHLCFASSYFDQLYDMAVQLIKKEKAYVCSLKEDELRQYRGDLKTPGKNSPYRDRAVGENLELFERMKAGEFKDGEHVLRAKIDMTSGNMNLRDPLIYRIRHMHHPITKDKWCIYPLYDFTHGLSDAIEGITHSLCSLEFEDHRPLYDWFLKELEWKQPPQQIEFAKGRLNFTVMGKRHLSAMVEEKIVDGWDDPRLPTLRGLRRRGYTPTAIKSFWEQAGVTKSDSVFDFGLLEESLRQDLNDTAFRRMAILDPIKVVLTNYPDDKEEFIEASNHPQKPEMGTRKLPFAKEIYIDRDDFMEEPPKKYFRLKPDGEVRLRNSYVIKCNEVIKNDHGDIIELRCTYDPETLGKKPEGRKVKGIVHWVSAKHAEHAEVRIYDRLFTVENPTADKERDFRDFLNSESLKSLPHCPIEPGLAKAQLGENFQFERVGYFTLDSKHSEDGKLVFNKSVSLKDTWQKISQ